MVNQKKWQKFESLVAHIQGLLTPQAEITLNKKILGKRSKTFREIDIAVSQNIGQHHIFIAIDCKDYKSPVDVKKVEEFIGLIEDVGANKGAIVSASGFTQAAKARAADAGIDVYRLVDAEKHDWQSRVLIPALCDLRKIKSFCVNTGPFKMTQDPETIILFNQNGEPIDTILNLLYKKWNARLLPVEPGEYTNIKITDITPLIKTDGKLYQFEVTVNICVEKDLYFGQLPLSEIKGFEDQISGGLVTNGFKTESLSIAKIERNWHKINSREEEELIAKPILCFLFVGHYPLIKHEA